MTTPSAFAILAPSAMIGDGEGDARLLVRLAGLFGFAVEQEMARDRARNRAERSPAQQEARGRAAEFSPDGHGPKH